MDRIPAKRSSFVAWILNYRCELTLTLTLNARNRNQKESGREQDSWGRTQVEANGMKTRSKQRTKTNIRLEKSEHAVNKHKKRSERLVRKVPCRSERTSSIWSRGLERDARNVFYACLQRVRSFPNESFVFVRCFERRFHSFRLDLGRDQGFVAPAPYHMPIEVVSVRVREHPHKERTPSGVVFWTKSDRAAVVIVRQDEGIRGRPKADQRAQWNQWRDEQTHYPRVGVNNETWALNQFNRQRKHGFAVQLFKSEKVIAIL